MIIIAEDGLERLKPLAGENKGSYGICFLYENNKVLKAYTNTMPFYYNKKEIKKNIKKNLNVYVDNVAFPIDIVEIEGYKFSYIMPYIDGISFDEMLKKIINEDFDVTFEEFIRLYNNAISKSYQMASIGIEINDFHKDNCKINDDFSIGIFDTDFYKNKKIFGGILEKYIRFHNMLEINDAFAEMLKCFYNKKMRLKATYEDNSELRKLYEIIDNFPKNKPNYVDDVLAKINDELKTDSVKKLILGDL